MDSEGKMRAEHAFGGYGFGGFPPQGFYPPYAPFLPLAHRPLSWEYGAARWPSGSVACSRGMRLAGSASECRPQATPAGALAERTMLRALCGRVVASRAFPCPIVLWRQTP
jgi:hypothetical protein